MFTSEGGPTAESISSEHLGHSPGEQYVSIYSTCTDSVPGEKDPTSWTKLDSTCAALYWNLPCGDCPAAGNRGWLLGRLCLVGLGGMGMGEWGRTGPGCEPLPLGPGCEPLPLGGALWGREEFLRWPKEFCWFPDGTLCSLPCV